MHFVEKSGCLVGVMNTLLFLALVFLFSSANGLVLNRGLRWNGQRSSLSLNSTPGTVSGSLRYGSLQHCGLLVSDVERSKAFYMDVFSFTDESHLRPKTLPYPGAFLNIAGQYQIHLMQLPTKDPKEGRPGHGGRDRHVAITINNIDILKDRLVARGLPYTMSASGRRALFCRDIDGNAFEFMEDASLQS